MIIVFSGLDCSGKSTQIQHLVDEISSRGAKSYTFWSRGGYTPGFQRLKDLARKLSSNTLPEPGFTPKRAKAFGNPIVLRIWLAISILDLIFYYGVHLRLKSLMGYFVVCDRYLVDTEIDFKLAYGKMKSNTWLLWHILKFVTPNPHVHFVSHVPVQISVERSKQKFEPFPDSPEVLAQRLKLYLAFLSSNPKLVNIDGTQDLVIIKNLVKFNVFDINYKSTL